MRYAMPLTALLLTLPLCAACAGPIEVPMPAVGCASLIPAKWADPVRSAAFVRRTTPKSGTGKFSAWSRPVNWRRPTGGRPMCSRS